MKEYIVKCDHLINGYGMQAVGELIRCKDCKHHRNRTGRCDVWSTNTDADGHCYKAKRNGK